MPSEQKTSYLSTMRLNLDSLSLTRAPNDIFKPLDSSKKQIRLLKVLPPGTPGVHPRDLACSLHIETLDSDLQFDALSYCWGKGRKRKKICIDGKFFRVTATVYEILKTLRSANGPSGYYWIDSICINQEDGAEKALQIPMMGRIFSQAEEVHVWLGPAVPDVARFLDADEKVRSEEQSNELEWQEDLDSESLKHRLAALGYTAGEIRFAQKTDRLARMLLDSDGVVMKPLIDIISSPWWRRLWVVQETLLARAVVLRCGDICIPWKRVMLACTYLRIRFMYRHLYTDRMNTRASFVFRMARVTELFEDEMRPTASTLSSLSHRDTYRFLLEINKQSVTDPRDRIYGMLALLPMELRIQPNYALSPDAVFTDFTLRFMQSSGSLNILALAGRPRAWDGRPPNLQMSLPSWVPYFPDMVLDHKSMTRDASRSAECLAEKRKHNELTIRGHIVGTVKTVASYIPDDPSLSSVREVLSDWRETFADQLTIEPLDRNRNIGFWRQLIKTIGIPSKGMRAHILSNIRSVSEELDGWLTRESITLSRFSATVQAHLKLCTNGAMFAFSGNQIGLCMYALQPGDRVVILAGCEQLIILRRWQNDPWKYMFIGTCICQGISNGEYIHDKAQLQVHSDEYAALPEHIRSFLKSAVHLYLAREDYLWAVDLDRMKSTLSKYFRTMFDGASQSRVDRAVQPMWTDIFRESSDNINIKYNAPASIIESIVSTRPHSVREFALTLQYCFTIIMIVCERLSISFDASHDIEMDFEVQDVKDAALRFGLLIFEIYKRTSETRLKAALNAGDEVVVIMRDALQSDLDAQIQTESVAAKWCQGLRLAAEEFLLVEEHVDEVFEEMILV